MGQTEDGVEVSGLVPCTSPADGVVQLNPKRPLVVLVHGCNFSDRGFTSLSEVFEAHDQQTVCFKYNDRSTLNESAGQLADALKALEAIAPGQKITVIGHSQGGLVTRRAFSTARDPSFASSYAYKVVTVSSPFSGISASTHCGYTWLHFVTLGLTPLVCTFVAGTKWPEIYPGSQFMTQPGALASGVQLHLRVATDERGRCGQRDHEGACVAPDEIFSLPEQVNAELDADPRVQKAEIAAGHSEVIGYWGGAPTQLISTLQASGILAQTPPERREQIDALLRRLYGPAPLAEQANAPRRLPDGVALAGPDELP